MAAPDHTPRDPDHCSAHRATPDWPLDQLNPSETIYATLVRSVPPPIIVAVAWGAAIIILFYSFKLLGELLGKMTLILIPMGIAILLAMLLYPIVDWLEAKLPRLPRMIHALSVVVGFFGITIWAFSFAGAQLLDSTQHLQAFLDQSIEIVSELVTKMPFQIDENIKGIFERNDVVGQILYEGGQFLQNNWRNLSNNVVTIGSNLATLVAGMLLVFIGLLFFLADGKRIWRWVVRLLPKNAEEPTYQAFRRGSKTLSSYVQSLLLVAAFDAIFIGLGAYLLGLPLVLPIMILVFIGAFVPIIGATLTGMIAVLIALAAQGLTGALIMIVVVLATQQLEGNVLQPLLLGQAVSIHPLAVLLSITFATSQFGIVGALFAVPITALVNSVMRYYVGDDPFPELAEDTDNTLHPPLQAA